MNMKLPHNNPISIKYCIYFDFASGALKSNCQTSSATKKEYEVELQKWFGNSRDRGSDSRKKIRRSTADNVENCNPETDD